MQNVNPYNRELFQSKFERTDTFISLKEKYDSIVFTKFFEEEKINCTPRQFCSSSRVSAVPWYYLDYLNSANQITDLGCGVNFFKPYFKNLQGIGAETSPTNFFGDVYGHVDQDFYYNHRSAFESVFSINALHFDPLENLKNICENFANMIKPSGRGFLALNAQRMIDRSKVFHNTTSTKILDTWIRYQFINFPANILVFDVDLSTRDASMDGNIRIVFEK